MIEEADDDFEPIDVAVPSTQASFDDSPTTDPAGAAFFEFLVECVEDWTSTNRIPWYTALGVVSLFDNYMKDLMLGRLQQH